MSKLLLHPTDTAQWHALVCEAEDAIELRLDEALESYLVFLLMRYTNQPEMVSSVLALEFLKAAQESGTLRHASLRDVGDRCLLYSGLFPQRAERLRVRVSYFVKLGRSAYSQLSGTLSRGQAGLYDDLAERFVSLMDVLQAMRELGDGKPALAPLHAFELWNDTGSRQARADLARLTDAIPAPVGESQEKLRN